jgi:hypothetical protein
MQPKLAVAPTVELCDEQLEIIGQINDLAYEHSGQTFEQLMQRVGIKFANEPSFEMFLAACREVFDRERLWEQIFVTHRTRTSGVVWRYRASTNLNVNTNAAKNKEYYPRPVTQLFFREIRVAGWGGLLWIIIPPYSTPTTTASTIT